VPFQAVRAVRVGMTAFRDEGAGGSAGVGPPRPYPDGLRATRRAVTRSAAPR
jgi:hypothetical protein